MITAYFDGSCEPNPGGVMKWAYIIYEDGKLLQKDNGRYRCSEDKTSTNNIAEYAALGHLLLALQKLKKEKEVIVVRGDSKMVIMQMKGEWNINDGLYKRIAHKVNAMKIPGIVYEWINRDLNEEADYLAKIAI